MLLCDQEKTGVYQQEESLSMGSPLSPVMVNIYIEYFEELALLAAAPKA